LVRDEHEKRSGGGREGGSGKGNSVSGPQQTDKRESETKSSTGRSAWQVGDRAFVTKRRQRWGEGGQGSDSQGGEKGKKTVGFKKCLKGLTQRAERQFLFKGVKAGEMANKCGDGKMQGEREKTKGNATGRTTHFEFAVGTREEGAEGGKNSGGVFWPKMGSQKESEKKHSGKSWDTMPAGPKGTKTEGGLCTRGKSL